MFATRRFDIQVSADLAGAGTADPGCVVSGSGAVDDPQCNLVSVDISAAAVTPAPASHEEGDLTMTTEQFRERPDGAPTRRLVASGGAEQ